MASAPSPVRSSAAVMRFPCGHSEPEASTRGRTRSAGNDAVWVACRQCNVIALACSPERATRSAVGKSLTTRTS